ncbi:MAG: 1-acyl-sn-glycerol-3-phosphate acyltransferase [Acholeplasmatales bacterium]|nr:1-acyl-sn-glycerol-3-phosphate acyltransferase [Acholeplasmatales bacterium]
MSKKKKFKKPNWFIYMIFRLVSTIIAKTKHNLKVINNETIGVKSSYVIIANHESASDFYNMSCAIKRRAHYVISNSFYQTLGIKPLLNAVGVIPKQQFQTTTNDMRKMKTVIENNRPIIIYPAGLMSESGITTPIPQGTGKYLKWLNIDVFVAYTEGSYLTNPKWSKIKRKGEVTLNITKLYSKDELKNLDGDTIQKKVEEVLYYDAYKNQEKNMVPFKDGDNIENFENVLYQCPKCNSLHKMYVQNKNELICEECGNKAIANKYGFLEPATNNDVIYKHPSDWVRMIQKNLKEKIDNNPDYTISDECEIHMINKNKFKPVGSGIITLNKDNFILDGVINNEKINKEFNIINYPILPFKPGICFEIQNQMEIYRIYPKRNKEVTSWIYTLNFLHQKKISNR